MELCCLRDLLFEAVLMSRSSCEISIAGSYVQTASVRGLESVILGKKDVRLGRIRSSFYTILEG